jgi:hypothetical protein
VPFFRWLLGQPEFEAARFDTTYLDRVLDARTEPFAAVSEAEEEIAAMAAALDAYFSLRGGGAAKPAGTPKDSAWKRAARLEGVRS